ncbi:MAG: ion channel [Gammaproteobacteria bacterium]
MGRSETIVSVGQGQSRFRDLYHWLLTVRWPVFFGFVAVVYVCVNLFFGALFWLDPGGVAHLAGGSFWDASFFSVQTLATIGYGHWYPLDPYAKIVSSIEPLIGFMGLALVTGILFARVSRPSTRIRFSREALITPFYGKPTLMFRLANSRHNLIVGGEIAAYLVRMERSPEGQELRRIYDLPLTRSHTPLFQMTWLVMHEITRESPFHGLMPPEEGAASGAWDPDAVLVVSFTGHDLSFSQTVYARHVYRFEDLRWNRYFANVTERLPDGRWRVDYSRFDELLE